MKLLFCEKCGEIIPIPAPKNKIIYCSCGNIGGIYQDNCVYANIYLRDEESFHTSKVLGLNNSILLGLEKQIVCNVGEWNDSQLSIFVDGTPIKYEEIKWPTYTGSDLGSAFNYLLKEIGKELKDISFIKDQKIKFKDGGYVLLAEQPANKDFIYVSVQKKDGYLIETKLLRY
ncbi:MAG: hypothetical protein WC503_00835 [Candidatus Shapirobacteria bacterium]